MFEIGALVKVIEPNEPISGRSFVHYGRVVAEMSEIKGVSVALLFTFRRNRHVHFEVPRIRHFAICDVEVVEATEEDIALEILSSEELTAVAR